MLGGSDWHVGGREFEGEARVEGAKHPRTEGEVRTEGEAREEAREGGIWGGGSVSPPRNIVNRSPTVFPSGKFTRPDFHRNISHCIVFALGFNSL